MTPYTAARPDLPPVSQPMPLTDFPPFVPTGRTPRALTCAESRELVLREIVREKKRARHVVRRGFTRIALAVLTVMCLPTVERIVFHFEDATPFAEALVAQPS